MPPNQPSVIHSEMHALTRSFNHVFVLRDHVEELLHLRIDHYAYVDSKNTFDVLTKERRKCEKRSKVDIHAIRES